MTTGVTPRSVETPQHARLVEPSVADVDVDVALLRGPRRA